MEVNIVYQPQAAEVRQVYDIRQQIAEIKALEKQAERNYLKIGRILYNILVSEGYTQLGYRNFQDFLDGEFSFERRTAQMFIRVWVYFGKGEAIKIPEEDLAEIGIWRAYVLTQLYAAGVLTKENVEEWLKKAKENSYRKFKLMADEAMGKYRKSEDELNWVNVRLRVPPEDKEFIEEVVRAIALMEGIEDEREIEKREGELIVKALRDWYDYYYPVLNPEEFKKEEFREFKLKQVKNQLEGSMDVVVHIFDRRSGQRIL